MPLLRAKELGQIAVKAQIDGLDSTEMMHMFIAAQGEDIRPGSTGRALPGYEAVVLDEGHRPLPRGSCGQCVRFRPFRISILADTAADFPSRRNPGRQAAGAYRLTARSDPPPFRQDHAVSHYARSA
jgi:hypothetical protein